MLIWKKSLFWVLKFCSEYLGAVFCVLNDHQKCWLLQNLLLCREREKSFVIILLTSCVFFLNSLGPIFALFIPFYCSIPRVQVTQILGQFSITNKTLVYILGLQVQYVFWVFFPIFIYLIVLLHLAFVYTILNNLQYVKIFSIWILSPKI